VPRSGKFKWNYQDILKKVTFTMTWHVKSNGEHRTHPQNLVKIQADSKTLSNKVYFSKEKKPLCSYHRNLNRTGH